MKAMTKRALIGASLASLAAACVPTAKLVSGAYPAAGYSVALGRSWSDITPLNPAALPNVRQLTVNGASLDRLVVASSIKPGEGLMKYSARNTRHPAFRTDMTDEEMVEFVVDCVAAMGYLNPETTALRPQAFGTAPGVRFDLSTRGASGLNYSGTALVARIADRAHLLVYLAPSEHYYAALLPEVERIFASVRLSA